jgi:antagonist of KipI
MGVVVQKPGLLTSVQDMGRFGYQSNGIITSGAMDTYSMKLANILVGNHDNEAVLEVTLIGPRVIFTKNALIAISGGNLLPTVNGKFIALNKPIIVKKDDVLEFGDSLYGCRCYIAFKGGIKLDKILGSYSTCLPAKFGGYHGRALQKGDKLSLHNLEMDSVKVNWQLSAYSQEPLFNQKPIRFIKGRQYDLFDRPSLEQFQKSTYSLSKDANRMGYRLEGPTLKLSEQQEMLTEGVAFGAVQVPPNGLPIILMADRQTTGGYPKFAQIASVDLPRLAQLKPGDRIHFSEITLSQAQELLMNRERELNILRKIIDEKWKRVGIKCILSI